MSNPIPTIDRPGIPAECGVTKATESVGSKSNGAIAIRLRRVIAWTEFTRNPTRFRFEG